MDPEHADRLMGALEAALIARRDYEVAARDEIDATDRHIAATASADKAHANYRRVATELDDAVREAAVTDTDLSLSAADTWREHAGRGYETNASTTP